MKKLLLFAFTAVVGVSCGTASNDKPESPSAIQGENATRVDYPNIINGVHFGMDKAGVQESAAGELTDEGTGSLLFTQDLDDGGFQDTEYTFGGQMLQKIEVSVFNQDLASAQKTYAEYTQKFDSNLTQRQGIWEGQNGNVPYTVYAKLIDDAQNTGVLLIWERI